MKYLLILLALMVTACGTNGGLVSELRAARQELAKERRASAERDNRYRAEREATLVELSRQLEAIHGAQLDFERSYGEKVEALSQLVARTKVNLEQALTQTDLGARKMIAGRLTALRTELMLLNRDSMKPAMSAAPARQPIKGVDPMLMNLDRPRRK